MSVKKANLFMITALEKKNKQFRMFLEKNVTDFIRSNDLISDKGPVIIGVSSGPDSVALTHILRNINRIEALECEFYIAHLNHKLRGLESEEDAKHVKNLARQLDLPILIKEVNVKKVSKESRVSVEEAARIERYRFLESCANEVGACHVAVAHTADDNVETLLLRMIRGTGILGLCSISPKRPISPRSSIVLIRPFLHLWKKDILEYLQKKDISFRVDSSNLQKTYLRNRIRLELLPLLEAKYNNQIKQVLSNLCEIFNENYKLIHDLSLSLLKNAVLEKGEDKYVLDNRIFIKSPEIVQQEAVHDVISNMGVPLKHIGYHKYKNIIKFIENGKDNDSFHLSAVLNVYKKEGKLFFQIAQKDQLSGIKDNEREKKLIEEFGNIELAVPGVTELPLLGSRIEAKVVEYKKGLLERFKMGKSMNEEAIDMAKVDFPLFVRLRRPGDRFWPIGLNGIKKIKGFFIDKKIPKSERDKIPIVLSKCYPIWVVGLRIDNRVRISETTKNVIILKYLTQP